MLRKSLLAAAAALGLMHGHAFAQGSAASGYLTGHVGSLNPYGTPPVVSSCGTGPTLSANSSDTQGNITVGTGATTACTVTFANPYGLSPACVVSAATSGAAQVAAAPTAISTTAVTFTMASSVASGSINYICLGR